LERFRFYRDSAKRGALRATLREMTPWQLVWVVDAPVPESELVWAQKHVNYPQRDWKNAYAHIRYRMDRATTRANIYKAYTLAEIEKEGGICGDQAYFASITAKANGVPAMIIGGEGDRGGHAWFGYLAGRDEWNLTSGRYADNYAAGTARDPQTRRLIKEHELKQLTDPARRTAPFDKSRKLVALAALLTEAGKLDLAALAYESALHAAPKNYDAWVATLDHLAATNAPTADWLRESARMRSTFREFPDLVQEIDQRELAYVTAHGDSDAARQLVHSQTARLESTDSSRTDLIMENVFREAALAEKSADPEAARRIYRDALRTKGGEVVAFKRIMQRYYDWAKAHGKGPEVTRELATDFDRQHREPADDVFALGSYRRVLRALSSMAGEQKLEPLQQSLDRREEMLNAREEKLDKLQSRGANIPRGGN
jgi:tetratricopeptide (TPR) repeat protein